MTPSLTPPTDNLYKFMAVFGLVMMITGIVLTHQMARDHQEYVGNFWLTMNKESGEALAVSKQRLALVKAMPSISEIEKDPTKAQAFKDALSKLEKLSEARTPQQAAEWDGRLRDYALASNAYHRESAEVFYLTIFGMVLSTVGFLLWYSRVQVYLDADLKSKVAIKHIPFRARLASKV